MSTQKSVDVYALGNALVDILAFVEDEFVEKLNFPKGSMNLVDTEKRTEILTGLSEQKLAKQSGGSAANSIIAVAQSGGSGIFVGKVANDENGAFYSKDMQEAGVSCDVTPGDASVDPSGTSIILTTPDAERTMCTHLGMSVYLTEDDVKEQDLQKCKLSYIEGYLWTGPETKAAAIRTMAVSKKTDTKVSFTFSDPFLVGLFAEEFKSQVLPNCDIVFCNADEAKSFASKETVEEAAKYIGELVETAFITDGKAGAIVVEKGEIKRVEGFKANAIDTVGAGDSFAGGVLYALANGYSAEKAAAWGNLLASKVVEVQGPRLNEIPVSWKSEIL